MSLIHTANLNRIAPFAYQVSLLEHVKELAEIPTDRLPWNYRERVCPEEMSA